MNIFRRHYSQNLSILLTLAFILILVTACGGTPPAQQDKGEQNEQSQEQSGTTAETESEAGQHTDSTTNPLVTIDMENGEQIKIELYPEVAPNTVANFISLIEQNFYDELIFHRVIPGFMIQGGDPHGNGSGGPGYSIKGEFTDNGFENNLSHERGVLSMARTQIPDSAGSQFFIMVDDVPQLDGQYAAFGKVIEGMEAVDNIVQVERNEQDKPLKDQRMKEVTVDTFGVDYAPPEIIK